MGLSIRYMTVRPLRVTIGETSSAVASLAGYAPELMLMADRSVNSIISAIFFSALRGFFSFVRGRFFGTALTSFRDITRT